MVEGASLTLRARVSASLDVRLMLTRQQTSLLVSGSSSANTTVLQQKYCSKRTALYSHTTDTCRVLLQYYYSANTLLRQF
eukprot:6482169-Amphidinium_carterae.1